MNPIRIGIFGYGNLGRGVHENLSDNPDMELVAVFTRRDPASVRLLAPAKVERAENVASYAGKIDVMVLCGGSATDLPAQGPQLLSLFNTVDSFDTHAKIPEYFAQMDAAGRAAGHVGAISVGWDPGLFSMARAMFGAFSPEGKDYTFWGRGVSQGHSDAIRRIPGVAGAIQYTVPVPSAIERVKSGENPALTTRQKHTRECYVVAEEGADRAQIERAIKEMPNYFADYDTTVHFITAQELASRHAGMPHGGTVIRSAQSPAGSRFLLELSIKLESNPEFTSAILLSYARAVARLYAEGKTGAVTVLDVPLAALSPLNGEELLSTLL